MSDDRQEIEIVDEATTPDGGRMVTLDVGGTEIRVRGQEVEIWPVDFDGDSI